MSDALEGASAIQPAPAPLPAPSNKHFKAVIVSEDSVALGFTYQQMDSLRDIVAQALGASRADEERTQSTIDEERARDGTARPIVHHLLDQCVRHSNYVRAVMADLDAVLQLYPDAHR